MARTSLRGSIAILILVWVVLAIAALVYSQLQNIPRQVTVAVLPAFLIEAGFYLLPASAAARRLLEPLPPALLALLLAVGAIAPYLALATATGTFRWSSLGLLAALVAVVAFWYVVLPKKPWADAAFLILVGAVYLTRVFQTIYSSPQPGLRLDILGRVMWIRLGASVILLLRAMDGIGFGFVPARREWMIGLGQYWRFLLIGVPLGLVLGLLRWEPAALLLPKTWLIGLGTFLATLWVQAVAEEFFFRGLLQQWLTRWSASPAWSLVTASLLFGLAHLSFRGFPNWKFAALSAAAGFFYGRAFTQANAIRASMVAHALVNTTWVTLFGKS